MSDQLNIQAMDALAKANEIRMLRAAEKKMVRRGYLTVADVLARDEWYWRSARIIDLLLCVDKVGRVKAERWLRMEMISPERRVGVLTQRERTALVRHIETWTLKRDALRRRMR